MTVINTNVKSLIAQNALKVNNRAMANAMEQLYWQADQQCLR